MTPGEELKHALEKLNIAFCLTTVRILLLKILTGQGSSEQVEALLESAGASSTLGVSTFFSTTQSSLSYNLMTLKNLMSAAEFAKVIEVTTSTLDHELRYFRDHFSLTRFEKLAVDTADQASNIIDSWHRIFRF